jgi:hypothetical protein
MHHEHYFIVGSRELFSSDSYCARKVVTCFYCLVVFSIAVFCLLSAVIFSYLGLMRILLTLK